MIGSAMTVCRYYTSATLSHAHSVSDMCMHIQYKTLCIEYGAFLPSLHYGR